MFSNWLWLLVKVMLGKLVMWFCCRLLCVVFLVKVVGSDCGVLMLMLLLISLVVLVSMLCLMCVVSVVIMFSVIIVSISEVVSVCSFGRCYLWCRLCSVSGSMFMWWCFCCG